MKSPFTGGTVQLKKKIEGFDYRKESFDIVYHYYLCNDTNEQFTTEELDNLNITQVHNQYRSKYGIPFADEIKAIRHKYNLSAAKMSEVLGFGANVYRHYEAGEVPTVANGRLIKLAEDPHEFRTLVHLNRQSWEEKEYDRVIKKLQEFFDSYNKGREYYEQRLIGCNVPNVYNGFRKPRLDKISAMVNFFAHHNQPFLTALNKLMFYADFAHYKKHGFAISGTCYLAFERGPVPDNYGAIYNEVIHRGFAFVTEVDFKDYVGEKFVAPKLKFTEEDELFSESEMDMMKKVSDAFKGMNTRQIVDVSHRESGWQQNVNDSNHINFMYGFDIKHL
ncbi:MAG: DUF4065 domain-containing protein [Bacteroidetes bacterium]|nr:MAG: DUF4065 domain-containing protein [Bacteroidota bacterium]